MASEPYKFRRLPKKRVAEAPPPYQTTLETHPNYLRAIGTLAVEIVNLEVMLADLLASILNVPEEAGAAIFFAPQATGPRIAIALKASEKLLVGHPHYLKKATSYIEKARDLANKRNDILHNAWGLSETNRRKVMRRRLPFWSGGKPELVPLSQIKDTIKSTRQLITKVVYLAREIEHDDAYAPSRRRQPEQPAAQNHDQRIHPKGVHAKRRRRPRSSRA